MKLQHEQTLSSAISLIQISDDENNNHELCLNRIQCLCISPNQTKLAVCFESSNHIVMYDLATNEEKDKFALKSGGKSAVASASAARKLFVVKGMAFSPDSDKIAIGQSDCVIYVYRIGLDWAEKKTIVNKFNLASPVASLSWLTLGLVYASIDGRVKFIQTSSNKMFSLLSSNSLCVSLSCSGDQVIAGFSSGLILFNSIHLRESSTRQVAQHSCPPTALVLTSTNFVCAGGCDGRVMFVELNLTVDQSSGQSVLSSAASNRARSVSTSSSASSASIGSVSARQTIEWGSDLSGGECSPSGTVIILSSRDNMLLFELEAKVWRHKMTINLSSVVLITGLCWSGDGTKLVCTSLNGAVELFRCRWKSKLIGARFEVNYVGTRQVVINDLQSKYSSMFAATFDIRDVKIIASSYTVIWTAQTLIMASLTDQTARSEIEWHGLTTEGVKFSFDYENVVLISAVGELFLIELGQDKILGSVRTDYISPHLLSVRINERKSNSKVFAYLLDAQTISVIDLATGLQICTWSHGQRIDWMELNETGNKLIYRDKALQLVLLNIVNQQFVVLLNGCAFVQWVPGSDVVVAQSTDKLYVWYDFTKPIIHSVSGGETNEAVEIERTNGATKVKMTLPNSDIVLDEVMLEFDTAMDDGDLDRAEAFLESLSESSENGTAPADINSMWLLLGNIALKSLNLSIGERAFAAVGDVAKVAFIKQCQVDSSMIALLDHDWTRFESGDFDSVLQTYISTYNWDRAIQFARRHGRSELVEDIQSRYYNWLIQTGQNSIAAQILEKSGKVEESIAMYLKAGRMFQVTKLISSHWNSPSHTISVELIRKVIDELIKKEAFEEAGDLYQLPVINDQRAALTSFIHGNAYIKAIQLARKSFPDEVVSLENQYGEYLLHEINDPANAVNHFIEAGKTDRALEAAINARQFDRAAEIASILDHIPSLYGKKIAEYYAAKEEIESALEMYLNSGCVRDAVQMLNGKGQYARAFKIAKKLMDPKEAKEMYEYIAKQYEEEGKYREAEKILLAAGDVDSAIGMYKSVRQYEQMIRLVKQYHPNLLTETCIYLGKQLEADRLYKQAETYYVSVQEWKLAVLMYTNAQLWEDAYRASRAHGGALAAKQVAFHWAQTMQTPIEAVGLLNRYGLLNQVVDYAIESNNYDFALSLIVASGAELKHKLIDVRLKYALHLENEGRFNEAEAMFVEANKPKEAVVMYLHANNFDEATRVAESLVQDDEVLKDVLTAQARFRFERDRAAYGLNSANFSGTLNKVESLLLRAGRIEVAIRLYKDVGLWNEAVRVAEQYAPHMIDSVKREMIAEASDSSSMYYQQNEVQSSGSAKQQQQQQSSIEPAAPQVDLYQSLKMAEQNDDKESIIRYTILLSTQLLKDRLTLESLKMLQKHDSVFILSDSKKLLSRIAVIILSELEDFTWSGTEGEEQDNRSNIYSGLRDCFLQLLSINNGLNQLERDLFEKYLLISHYLTLKSVLESIIKDNTRNPTPDKNIANFRELYFKITVSLLRYTDVIRADKAFYEAGMAAREANRYEMAFVFLNHFLDLLDAIEEHDYNVDHSDFVGTDIPYEVPLPSKLYYEPAVIEQIKSWILATSMDTELSQTLPLDPLRDGEVYEASLINADGSKCLPCLVTAYPVIRHKMMEFKPNKYAANKEDWNKLLMLAKITENKELRQVLHFIGRLCGNSTIVKFSFQ